MGCKVLKIDFHTVLQHNHFHNTMSYTLSVFAELRVKYPTWDLLSAYLTSDDGGKLRVITTEGSTQAMIRYTKNVSKMDVPHVFAFRSVVWDTHANLPVSVAPVQSWAGLPEYTTKVQVSEFIDGTMMHGFCSYLPDSDGVSNIMDVNTATRTVVGSSNKFYGDRTFAELLDDATSNMGGTRGFLYEVMKEPRAYVNMVLQHPEHKTVTALAQPRVYITHYGTIALDGTVQVYYDPAGWPKEARPFSPRIYENQAVMSAEHGPPHLMKKCNPSPQGHVWQGLVFQDCDGVGKWRMRTHNYMAVRALRGSESQMYERFLRLRMNGEMKDYLKYFPEDSKMLWACEQSFRNITTLLLDGYAHVFKLKTHTFTDFHVCMRPHMYALHGMYIESLKSGIPTSIIKQTVIDYINSLHLDDQKNLMRHLKDVKVGVREARPKFVDDSAEVEGAVEEVEGAVEEEEGAVEEAEGAVAE